MEMCKKNVPVRRHGRDVYVCLPLWCELRKKIANLLAHLSQGKVNMEDKVFTAWDSLDERPC